MVATIFYYALGVGLLYMAWFTVMAGGRYELRRPRFVVWSAPGMVIQGGLVTYLLGQYRLVLPTILLVASAVRTIRIERKRGEQKPFISTLQLWPLEIAVLLASAGVEYLVSSALGFSTAPLF